MSKITQRGAVGALALQAGGSFQQSNDANLSTLIGSRWDLDDGGEVRLVLAGASNLAAGKLMQSPATVANHQGLTVTAVQAYSANGNVPEKVTVTLGATAATANQYAGGYLVVSSGTGLGQTLRIASHPAANLSSSLALTLEDVPNTALTTSSVVDLIPAECNGVVISDHIALTTPVGVTLYPITAANYGYVKVKGIVSCLHDGIAVTGSALSQSNAVDGAVENGVIAQGFVGQAILASTDTQYQAIRVQL